MPFFLLDNLLRVLDFFNLISHFFLSTLGPAMRGPSPLLRPGKLLRAQRSSGENSFDLELGASATRHSSSKRLKSAENKFTWSDFTRFSNQVSADSHSFCFRSLHVLHSKFVKVLQSIFHFLKKYFLAGFTIWVYCARVHQLPPSVVRNRRLSPKAAQHHRSLGEWV